MATKGMGGLGAGQRRSRSAQADSLGAGQTGWAALEDEQEDGQ